jgi:hypothetical protein
VRLLISLIAVLAVAGMVWLLVGGQGGRAEPLPAAAEAGSPSEERPTAAAALDGEAAPRTERAPVLQPQLTEGEVVYRIRVMRAGTGEPIAGAKVYWLPPTVDTGNLPAEDGELADGDFAALVVRRGESRTTDAGGEVAVPGRRKGVTVYGYAGSLYGYGYFREPEAEAKAPPKDLVLELAEDRTLLARAVDTLGQPLQGITILMEAAGGPSAHGTYLQPTGADGLTSLRHAQVMLEGAKSLSLAARGIGRADRRQL